ncbi:MAG TPA: cation:proton antiporter [Rhodanobacteraceae bacterium]
MNAIASHLLQQLQLPLRSPVLIFSVVLFIILVAPLVFERIHIPRIIGLIVAGVLIGPFGFNVLDKSLFVDVFSTIGILYIMFIAGLELNLNEFRINRNKSIAFGVFTFVIPLLIGFPICYYLLHFDFFASLLVSSIFSTHTLVTYPIASRFGVSKDASVAVTVGGTILTDAAVLIVLAIIVGAQHGGLTAEFWVRLTLSIVAFSAFMFLVIPNVAHWVFEHLERERHLLYIFVLAIAFLAAFLAELASLEAIIGAFAAGLALNKLIPHSSALMNRIEFIGNALFIPFFLISVGMLVDVRVFLGGPAALIDAAALVVAAIVGKYAAAWATQLAFRYSRDQRHLIFGLSTAHAAATLAVILVGFREGIVDDSVLNAVVLIILVSCVVASVVTQRAAQNVAQQANAQHDPALMSELDMEQIVVPISDTTDVEKLLQLAVLIKDKRSTHPLVAVNVVPDDANAEQQAALARKRIETFLSETTGADVKARVVATIDRNVASGICRIARELSADVAILGWPQHGHSLGGWISTRTSVILRYAIETLFVCHLPRPLVEHANIFLVVPENAEHEAGFPVWLAKIAALSTELSLPVKLKCAPGTHAAITGYCTEHKLSLKLEFSTFSDWEDLLVVFRDMADDDLMIVVGASSGQVSYNDHMDTTPDKLGKHFAAFNKILVYPQ